MFGFLNGKDIDERDTVGTNKLDLYPESWLVGIDPTESPINFDTLNTLTKEYYSPQARVKRMLQHAKVAAEKGSWWCNIPEVGEKEIELLKQRGLRVFKKTVDNIERSQIFEEPPFLVKYSINWSDKDVTPSDQNLVEL